MAEDIQISDRDHILGDDNNYLRTTTSAAKVYRCYMAFLGKWPGGRGDPIGNAFHERNPVKDTPETRDNIVTDGEDALAPLVDSGHISEVAITVVDGPRPGKADVSVSWLDAASQQRENIKFPVPWGV